MSSGSAGAPFSWQSPNVLARLLTHPAAGAVVALALVLTLGAVFHADGSFYRVDTHRDTLRQVSVFGILACGMTLVILCGGIDLSVGSVLALTAVCFSLASIHWGWPWWAAVPASLAVGLACGLLSGFITAWCGVQPFIATLAMMVFARGLAKVVSGGMKISTYIATPDGGYRSVEVPEVFHVIDSRVFGGNVAVVTIVFLVCAALTGLMLWRHVIGRELYAIGGNEEAARLAGVPVRLGKLVAYGLCGLLAGVAGVCQAAQEQQGDPEAGAGYELSAIAIVVIGGTSLTGGQGGMLLTLIGTLTIGYLEKILSLNAVPEAHRLMLTGAIIVAAVLAQRARRTG